MVKTAESIEPEQAGVFTTALFGHRRLMVLRFYEIGVKLNPVRACVWGLGGYRCGAHSYGKISFSTNARTLLRNAMCVSR